MSAFFPQEYDASSLKDYAEISPLKAYASALETLFGERRGDVTFSDRGSVSRDNLFCVKISPDSADIFYDLYVVNRRTDGTYCDHNIDIQDDWDSLTFSYAPEWAVEITLNGLPLRGFYPVFLPGHAERRKYQSPDMLVPGRTGQTQRAL